MDLRGVHMVLERSANGSANGGVAHEQTDRSEGPAALQGHHKWAQLEVLLGAARRSQAGCNREGEDGLFAEGTIGLELDRTAGDVGDDGGDTMRMLSDDVLG